MTDQRPTPPIPQRLRRAPQQARSRARIGEALDAAERLLVSEGAGAVTTTRVAAEAGAAVGSVYRYFPDKSAIFDALATRYLGEFEALMEEMVTRAGDETWEDPIGLLIDVYVDHYRIHPALRALWFGRHLSDEIAAVDRLHKRTMAEGVRRILTRLGLVTGTRSLSTVSHAAVLTADALIQESFRTDAEGDPALLAEAKRILRAYLADLQAAEPATEKGRR